MLATTPLISFAPKPVTVRLCFGLVKSGPTGPCRSEIGALVEGLLALVSVAIVERAEERNWDWNWDWDSRSTGYLSMGAGRGEELGGIKVEIGRASQCRIRVFKFFFVERI